MILLLDFLKEPITSRLNKKEIVKMIEEKGIQIPKKNEKKLPTMWEVVDIRYGDIGLKIHGIGMQSFEFMDGDIIQFTDGIEYYINNIVEEDDDTIIIHMSDKHFKNSFTMNVNDFIMMIDNEDITIVKSQTRKYKNLM